MIGVYDLWQLFDGECFYCGRQTWVEGIESKSAAKRRLGLEKNIQLRDVRATREHLHRRADGGGNVLKNLVLACNSCNGSRGIKPVLLHLSNRRR